MAASKSTSGWRFTAETVQVWCVIGFIFPLVAIGVPMPVRNLGWTAQRRHIDRQATLVGAVSILLDASLAKRRTVSFLWRALSARLTARGLLEGSQSGVQQTQEHFRVIGGIDQITI